DRFVQDGAGPPARAVAQPRTSGTVHNGLGGLVQPAPASFLVRRHPTRRVRGPLGSGPEPTHGHAMTTPTTRYAGTTNAEAASPPLIIWCVAHVTGPPLRPQGSLRARCRDGLRPPLTPEPLRPGQGSQMRAGTGPAPPGARHTSKIRKPQDQHPGVPGSRAPTTYY